MATSSQTLHTFRLLATGTILMLTVSLATAAIVMWIPESPVELEDGSKVATNLSEYVLLHRARNAVVPPYLGVDVYMSSH